MEVECSGPLEIDAAHGHQHTVDPHLEGAPSPGYLQSRNDGCLHGYSHPYCAPEGDPCE